MFTGLIECKGRVEDAGRRSGGVRLSVEPLRGIPDLEPGESIAVDGVCLTATQCDQRSFMADVSAETLERSTLGYLKRGDEVNLERALRLGDRLGGHIVTGHVDGMGRILRIEARRESTLLRIGIDQKLSRFVIEKGSVAVAGVSLTVNRCEKQFFEVNIIPHTGMETTLLKRKAGDRVNIETDMIGKYIDKLLSRNDIKNLNEPDSGVDPEMLRKYGYVK
jgi:riboflavin synthase